TGFRHAPYAFEACISSSLRYVMHSASPLQMSRGRQLRSRLHQQEHSTIAFSVSKATSTSPLLATSSSRGARLCLHPSRSSPRRSVAVFHLHAPLQTSNQAMERTADRCALHF